MNEFDLIETDRLIIRILMMKDKEEFFNYRSKPEIYQYQAWRPKDRSDIEDFINRNQISCQDPRNTWVQMAVCLKQGQLIGDIGIHFMEDDLQVELGYTLAPEYHGNGYAIEAVRAIFDYVFTNLGKHRITASVDPNNMKSIKLLEKIGFRKEAHYLKSFRMNDEWYDDCVYAVLEEEWNKRI